jgi:gliding motility-associated-like protein
MPTVANIAVDSPATVVWYGSPTDTTPISPSRLLTSGTYYAVNNYGACSSAGRLAITVIISDIAAPTGKDIQYMCVENVNTVASLEVDQSVVWYDAMTGGNALSPNTVLEHGKSYYASQIGTQCESIQRLKVIVVINNCDVVINNAVSANNDGKNDYLSIEGIEYFKENHLEIFNRWGSKVFETTHYGMNDNYFRGYPNTGVGASDGAVLPFGTYYYVLEFVDHNGQSQSKTGYIHLNH